MYIIQQSIVGEDFSTVFFCGFATTPYVYQIQKAANFTYEEAEQLKEKGTLEKDGYSYDATTYGDGEVSPLAYIV